MSFSINQCDEFIRRIHGDKGHLIGLISEIASDNFRVELMMKIDQRGFETFEAAVAFVRGAEAAMRAFKIIPTAEKEAK